MKPGIKTTEFALVIVANALVLVHTIPVPDRYVWIKPLFAAATIIGYSISRGLAKMNPAAAIDLGPLFDPSLDDPSFAAGEPTEPPATSTSWRDEATAAGWQPPAPPLQPTPGAV